MIHFRKVLFNWKKKNINKKLSLNKIDLIEFLKYFLVNPTNAICSRGDLIMSTPKTSGCTDTKVTNYKNFLKLVSHSNKFWFFLINYLKYTGIDIFKLL